MIYKASNLTEKTSFFSKEYLEEKRNKSYYKIFGSTLEMLGLAAISLDLGRAAISGSVVLNFTSFAYAFGIAPFNLGITLALFSWSILTGIAAANFASYSLYKIYDIYKSSVDYRAEKKLAASKEIEVSSLDKDLKTSLELHSLVEAVKQNTDGKDKGIYVKHLLGNFARSVELEGKAEGGYLTLLPYSKEYINKKKSENNWGVAKKFLGATLMFGYAIFLQFSYIYPLVPTNPISLIPLVYFAGKAVYEGVIKIRDNNFYNDIAKKVKLSDEHIDEKALDLQTGYNRVIDKATKGNDTLRREVVKSFVDYVNQSRTQVQVPAV